MSTIDATFLVPMPIIKLPKNEVLQLSDVQKYEVNKKEYEETKEKIVKIFENQLFLNKTNAEKTTNDIFTIQNCLKSNEAITLKATENCPFDIIITPNLAFCIDKKIGEGQSSLVYQASGLATHRIKIEEEIFTPSKTTSWAVKKSKDQNYTYSPEKRITDSLNEKSRQGIDYSFATFKEESGHGLSIHKLRNTTLNRMNFHALEKPIEEMIKAIYTILTNIENLHNENRIHRDIKGANILVSIDKNGNNYILTDCETIGHEFTTCKKTRGTVPYLDPLMFGSAENTLLNQKMRYGCQTKEGDIFALGITIIYDVILDFFKNTKIEQKNQNEFNQLIKKIKPEVEYSLWTDEELQNIGSQHPFRAMYSYPNHNTHFALIYVYPQLRELRSLLHKMVYLFYGQFSQKELYTLSQITSLACDMQDASERTRRPTAETAKSRIASLYHIHKGNCFFEFPYAQMKNPLSLILNTLRDSAKQVVEMHKINMILKDIKGVNILIKIGNEIKGSIADLGLASLEKENPHTTTGTPAYLDPAMFGSPEETLLNQKQRYGLQNKEGDIFAFGITIIYDIVRKLLLSESRKTSEHGKIFNYLQHLLTEKIEAEADFDDEELKKIGSAYPYRAMYDTQSNKVILYPTIEQMQTTIAECLKLLENTLTSNEIETVNSLVQLACNMQGAINRPTAVQVLEAIAIIQNQYESSSIEVSSKSTISSQRHSNSPFNKTINRTEKRIADEQIIDPNRIKRFHFDNK